MTANQLRKQREKLGLSQRQLSLTLGYAGNIVCIYEKGERPIPDKFTIAFDMLKEKLKG